ncbi:DUF742 domain-containing protein [Actinomadura flavalba]|uniref:DUF742 domain-containing protein n=1 Tax=Actinomadura flavalba TaxID=1120938 RepID=UPI000369AE8D|nr:DUF742 domain-containing protein [Actinomadura flavalba]
MNPRDVGREDPDRLFIVTGGRADTDGPVLDLVSLIVGGGAAPPGTPSEQAGVLARCRDFPVSVAELSAHLDLPVSVVKIVLRDLAREGRVTVRPPVSAPPRDQLPDLETLRQVLVGLHDL